MKSAAFHPEAEDEFALAVGFYAQERPALGQEFTDAVYHAVGFVCARPEAGTPVRGRIRRWLVRRFPYGIIYREEADRLYILAVAHHRRRPDYWHKRA